MAAIAKMVSVVEVPFWRGQPKPGVDAGPAGLKAVGLVHELTEQGWTVEDKGQVALPSPPAEDAPHNNAKNPRAVGTACKAIHDSLVAEHLKSPENRVVLALGGDHSIAIGTISAALQARPETCVIWVDAHCDINTPECSPSGNIHGMPVAYLMGLSETCRTTPEFGWLSPSLAPSRIVYIGVRDVDAGERQLLREHNIKAFSASDIERDGIAKVVEKALDHVDPERTRPLHLSFDIDALDPSWAPATGTPVVGGMTFREGRYLCETIFSTGRLRSMDMVEVNPKLSNEDGQRATLKSSLELCKSALGATLL